jgi:hypothetical protein
MSPQAAAEHLWARKGSGAFGFAREREASALTGDIARFWSKVRGGARPTGRQYDDRRLVDLVGSARCFTHRA